MRTILAIDWGKKRVGVARADVEARIPEPLTTLPHTEDLRDRLDRIVREEQARLLVVGLPRNLSGEETSQSREIREFAESLKGALQCEVVFMDETLSTQQVQQRRAQHPEADTDSLAATVILEDYMESA